MLHALGEKSILLLDQLRRNFEDCGRTLMQAFNQPIRRLKSFDNILLVLLAMGGLGDLSVVAVINQTSGKFNGKDNNEADILFDLDSDIEFDDEWLDYLIFFIFLDL